MMVHICCEGVPDSFLCNTNGSVVSSWQHHCNWFPLYVFHFELDSKNAFSEMHHTRSCSYPRPDGGGTEDDSDTTRRTAFSVGFGVRTMLDDVIAIFLGDFISNSPSFLNWVSTNILLLHYIQNNFFFVWTSTLRVLRYNLHIFQFTAPADRFARMKFCRQIDRVLGFLRAEKAGEANFRLLIITITSVGRTQGSTIQMEAWWLKQPRH